MYTLTGDLDKNFLQHVVSVENNSFINVLHTETDGDNAIFDQPQIISHSPYYKADNLISTLSQSKNKFSILSTNIQSIRAKFDELKIFIEYLSTLKLNTMQLETPGGNHCCLMTNDVQN